MATESTYSVGHKEGPLAYLRFRTAERSCGFFRDHIGSASRILDCGCGPGSITIGLAQWAPDGQTIGVDIGAEQLDGARARARDLGVKNVAFSISPWRTTASTWCFRRRFSIMSPIPKRR